MAGQRYFFEVKKQDNLSWILKARCDLIELNANRFQVNAPNECSLCNLNEQENIYHFIGHCPALKEIRLLYLHKCFLNEEEIINILNGIETSFDSLAMYIKICIDYRKFLITEFNY